ncbi:hypothetical protein [Pseudaminobacter sp. NGMCC 1.201702]|uniref:hypothetical protein n=1 Tax=Pseudaminobacter sp. NGMCC 1.201702 TaxID=3391825 RepID=UPI0039F13D33
MAVQLRTVCGCAQKEEGSRPQENTEHHMHCMPLPLAEQVRLNKISQADLKRQADASFTLFQAFV